MENLIKRQAEPQRQIGRFWENLLKTGKDKRTQAYLTSRLEVLEKYWTNFETTHQEIALCERALQSDYYQSDQFSITEEKYIEVKSLIKEVTNGLRVGEAVDRSTNEPSPLALMQQMQMPKAELPKFSGQQRDWEGFRDSFISLVHDIREVPGSHKMQLLRASLTDEA